MIAECGDGTDGHRGALPGTGRWGSKGLQHGGEGGLGGQPGSDQQPTCGRMVRAAPSPFGGLPSAPRV